MMSSETSEQRLRKGFSLLSTIAACVVLLICCILSAGWVFEIEQLYTPIAGAGSISFAACISFALLAVFILLRNNLPKKGIIIWPTLFCSTVLAFIAAARLWETASAADWFPSIDVPMPGADRPPLSLPGATSADFCTLIAAYSLSLSIVCLPIRIKRWHLFELTAMAGSCVSLLPIVGYLSGQDSLCTIYGCIKQPLAMSFMSMLIAFAILFGDIPPDSPLTIALAKDRTGSMFRTALLLILVACPVAFLLKTAIIATKIVEAPLASTVSLTALLIMSAKMLWKAGNSTEQPLSTANSTNINSTTADELDTTRATGPRQVLEQNDARSLSSSPSNHVEHVHSVVLVCDGCRTTFTENLERCPTDGNELRIEVIDQMLGKIFVNKYRIESLLGKGGMSTVYLATHTLIGKQVAIKILHSNIVGELTNVKRFQHEAKAMSLLKHPNILEAFDFGFFDGMPYIVMNLIEGESLAQVLKSTGPLSPRHFFEIAQQICSALKQAHQRGIVHRDLKPANIMLTKKEDNSYHVMVVDFGLAKLINGASELSTGNLTQTGDCMGSPLYMSPEQIAGDTIDHRTDIYALGCLLFESLAGAPPIGGQTALMVMQGHLWDEPSDAVQKMAVPGELKQIIYKMLQKPQADRPGDIDEVIEALTLARNQATIQGC